MIDHNTQYDAEQALTNRPLWMFCLAKEVGIDVDHNGRSSCTCWSIHECDKIQSATVMQRARALYAYNNVANILA